MAHETIAPWGERIEGARPMTADELYAMGDASQRHELVEGVLVKMPPTGFQHGRPLIRLSSRLFAYVDAHQLGEVMPAEEGFILSPPGQGDTVLAPDVAFVRAECLPALEAPGSDRFLRLAPDLVAEVASPGQYKPELAAKARVYLGAGVRLVWIVWPATQTVDVWRPGGDEPVATLGAADALDGLEVVPGFTCPVADLFR